MTDDDAWIRQLGKDAVTKMAEEICSVQPMPNDAFRKLYEAASTEEELIAAGYEPVCEVSRLMWRKK